MSEHIREKCHSIRLVAISVTAQWTKDIDGQGFDKRYLRGDQGQFGPILEKKSTNFEWLLQLAPRNLYFQIGNDMAVPVLVKPFVCLCVLKGNRQPMRSGHDGRTYPAKGQVRPPSGQVWRKYFSWPITLQSNFS